MVLTSTTHGPQSAPKGYKSAPTSRMTRVTACLAFVAVMLTASAVPVQAASTAAIGSVTTGTRPGSDVGRNSTATLPTLRYCITYTTTDQAMDYGYEVVDALGARPPFGSAYSSFFVFVPSADWAAGSRMAPRVVCNTTTLESGKSYTVRAWATSGLLDDRGTWAITGPSAPTLASYSYSTASVTTTTVLAGSGSSRSSNPSASGGGANSAPTTTAGSIPSGQRGGISCPASAPVVAQVGGNTYCVPLDTYCASNPGWSDSSRGLFCPAQVTTPVSNSARGAMPTCNSSVSSQREGRATIKVSVNKSLARSSVEMHVFRSGTWFVLGASKVTRAGSALVNTESPIINAKRTYKTRLVQGSRVVCEGLLTVRSTMRLRGTPTRA